MTGEMTEKLYRDIAYKAMSNIVDEIYDSGFDPEVDYKTRYKAQYNSLMYAMKKLLSYK